MLKRFKGLFKRNTPAPGGASAMAATPAQPPAPARLLNPAPQRFAAEPEPTPASQPSSDAAQDIAQPTAAANGAAMPPATIVTAADAPPVPAPAAMAAPHANPAPARFMTKPSSIDAQRYGLPRLAELMKPPRIAPDPTLRSVKSPLLQQVN